MRDAMCALRGLCDLDFGDFVARIRRLRVTLAKRRLYKTRAPKEKAPDVSIRGFSVGLASETS